MTNIKIEKRGRRKKRIRSKIHGTGKVPRLNVFRSGKHIYAQVINDDKGVVMAHASSLKMKAGKKEKDENSRRTTQAYAVGEEVAKKAAKKKIKKVVFDRGGYRYHGRVKSLAEGARRGGLKF